MIKYFVTKDLEIIKIILKAYNVEKLGLKFLIKKILKTSLKIDN